MIDEIRRAKLDDYDSIVAINNATWPQYETSKAEMLEDDRRHKARYHTARLVATIAGEVVGVGQYDQLHADYDPHMFWVEINVHPHHQREGIGRAIYAKLRDEMKQFQPRHIRAVVRDDNEHGRKFFTDFGFTEKWIAYNSVLKIGDLSKDKVQSVLTDADKSGIRIASLASLSADRTREIKAYALHVGTRRSAPMAAPAAELSFETYVNTVLRAAINPDSYFVAVKNGEYIGLAILERQPEEKNIRLVWLGTDEHFRRQGVATALIAHCVNFAKSKRYSEIQTSLTSLNPPMLGVAEKFGFKRPYGIVHVQLDLAEPTEEQDKNDLEVSSLKDDKAGNESK